MKILFVFGLVVSTTACYNLASFEENELRSVLEEKPGPSPSAPSDGGVEADACQADAGTVVGHCLTDMATLCIEYSYDNSYQCNNSKTLTTGWASGPCGSDSLSDLSRSSGGCQDPCTGQTSWYYSLGGGQPTDATKADIQSMCQQAGLIYLAP